MIDDERADALPLWECGADGVWSRGPLNDTAAWVYETTFAYRSGRALAPMGPARQTLEDAMRDADTAALAAGCELPWDSMVPDPELVAALRGLDFELQTYGRVTCGDWIDGRAVMAMKAIARRLPGRGTGFQDGPALARILRAHGAIVLGVRP